MKGWRSLLGLWQGRPFSFEGKHYTVNPTFSSPLACVQQPRIPIWVVGAWPSEKSMQRALRYDGLLPQVLKPAEGAARAAQRVDPDHLRAIQAYVAAHRAGSAPFDIVIEGDTPGDNRQEAARVVAQWEEAGATWWLEGPWDAETEGEVRKRMRQGPPGESGTG